MTPGARREIMALRPIALCALGLFLTVLGCSTPDADQRLDAHPVTMSPTDVVEWMEDNGDVCWSGASSLEANMVVFTDDRAIERGEQKNIVAEISNRPYVMKRAIDDAVYDIDRGITVHAFCYSERFAPNYRGGAS